MMSDSPFHCVDLTDLPEVEDDMRSIYPDPMSGKSLTLTSLDHKYFTVDGGKIYANLEQSNFSRHTSPSPTQVLPNIETFSRNCDSSLSPLYDSALSSPVTTSPPHTLGATPIIRQTWKSKHPGSWTSEDVLDWIFHVAGFYNIDGHLQGEAFSDITGQNLLTMDPEGFKLLTPVHYMKFYTFFKELKKRSDFKAPQDQDSPLLSSTSEHLQVSGSSHSLHCFDYNMGDTTSSGFNPDLAVIQMHRFDYPVDLTDNFEEVMAQRARREVSCSDDGYSSGGSDNRNNVIEHTDHFRHQHQQHQQHHHQLSSHYPSAQMSTIPILVEDPAELHIMEEEEEEDDDDIVDQDFGANNSIRDNTKLPKPEGQVVRTRGRKPGQTTRGNHLWEFVRDLLKDERYSPSLIKWENREQGVFRFVQSAQVAKMWGRRKNNQTMNYEKLSRAMRFCRDKDYFATLPKGEKYPKKLCFRFGVRAHGWQTDD